MLVLYSTSYDTEYIFILCFIHPFSWSKWYPWGWLLCGRMKAFVNYSKVGGKCMLFFSFIIYMSWKGLQKTAAPNSNKFLLLSFFFFTCTWWEIISSQRAYVENQPLWCERGVCVWSPLHSTRQALWSAPLPSYTLALIASLFCA